MNRSAILEFLNLSLIYLAELKSFQKNEINNLEIYTKQMQGDNLESTTPTTTNQSNEENSKSDPRDKEYAYLTINILYYKIFFYKLRPITMY